MTTPTSPSVAAYRAAAQANMDSACGEWLAAGDDGSNEAALARLKLMPRPLRDLRGGHTRLRLFDQSLAHPIVLAPIAYQALFHPEAEVASAMAADAQDGLAVVSSLASRPIASIAAAARGAKPWFQLYWQGDRERTLRLARRALDAGCTVIVFTVDAPVKLATLALPSHVRAVNLEPEPARSPVAPGASAVFDHWMGTSPTWDDVAWLRETMDVPLVLKGVLHPDDAARALALGCDGLIVSNHGGRVMPGVIAAVDALPAVVERVGARVPVLFDSGIRCGEDVVRALALGARAVLVGRPCMWGLAAAGAMGVAHVIRLLRDELEMTMALCGCRTLDDVGPGVVLRSQPRA